MVSILWTETSAPSERHIVVHVHQDGLPRVDKGYFFVSDEKDWGGSGPFDMRLQETIKRAEQRARELDIETVVVIPRP